MSEKIDYRALVARIKRGTDRFERIESMIGAGIPDINYCINGVEGWIELKSPTEPKREHTPLFGSNHRLLQSQMNWHLTQRRAGGISFVLICTEHWWLLIEGKHADVINDLTLWQLIDLAVWSAARPVKYATLWSSLREHLQCRYK